MAGNYSDAPSHRMAYDRDGTVAHAINHGTGAITVATTAQLQAMNNEAGGTWSVGSTGFTTTNTSGVLLFPEYRDILGVWHGASNSNVTVIAFESSVDTSNGLDGTWVGHGTYTVRSVSDKISMRNNITPYNITGVKAIRWRGNNIGGGGGNNHVIKPHVYGVPSAGQAPNRLRFWDATLDQKIGPTFFDWGDLPANSTHTRAFRIKNPSATLTAQTITLSTTALTDSGTANVDQFAYSLNGVDFAPTLIIADLPPGAISSEIILRRSLPASAPMGLWWVRHIAAAASYV